ncbi:MAG: hypothetical protein HYV07_08560 [Deltaproteobacteria bacterium]|nr:hypothetical protein [Deltaproteobacteria bacterium]
MASTGIDRIAANPFYVLELPASASAMEVEREGHKLLAMFELGLAAARSYDTPLGARPRDKELIRWAIAELRDPRRRLLHEVRASLPADAVLELGDPDQSAADHAELAAPWDGARRAFGFER